VLFAVYLTSAGTLACLSGHPRVALSAHGSDVNDQIGSRVWRAVFRWQFRRARLVHVVSDLMARALQERAGLDARKTVVAAVGTDPRLFAFVAPAARPKGRIVCTRAHDPLYRQDTVVRALRRLRDRDVPCHLTFGHAKGAEHTRALVEELGVADCVTFLPGYRRAELPALLAGATVYVSASRSDGTSVSLLEALSTGLFPVVSDIPANRPWVEHGRNGFLFPVGDEAALADRLAEALARPDLRAAAAPISRELVVRNGDAEPLADRVLAAVRAVVP
jgi:glycosyltransferase involved in cell wall biosynthesis